MNSVNVAVAQQISDLGPKVQDKVVGALVDRELDRRSDALVQAIDHLAKFEKELKKLGPDQIAYNEKGEKTSETYSKARTEEREKLAKKIDKYTKAITKALENKEFGDVYNLASDKDQG